MSILSIGLLYGGATLLVMFAGMPIAFALGAVATVFMVAFMPKGSVDTITQNVYEEMASITLLSIPLFILKGAAIGRSRAGPAGLSSDVLEELEGEAGELVRTDRRGARPGDGPRRAVGDLREPRAPRVLLAGEAGRAVVRGDGGEGNGPLPIDPRKATGRPHDLERLPSGAKVLRRPAAPPVDVDVGGPRLAVLRARTHRHRGGERRRGSARLPAADPTQR